MLEKKLVRRRKVKEKGNEIRKWLVRKRERERKKKKILSSE